jgi:hypothetical protein
MSAMLLEKNGKQSSSKRTKHIRVTYFFIKDRVNNGDITIKHCPTGEMSADHFTKPLQGALFRKFRTEIQGIPEGINEAELGWDLEERKEHKKMTQAHRSVLRQRETCIHEQGIQDSGRNISWPYIRSYGRLDRLSQR